MQTWNGGAKVLEMTYMYNKRHNELFGRFTTSEVLKHIYATS